MLTTTLSGSVTMLIELFKRLLSLVTGKGWAFILENAMRRLATFIVAPLASLTLTIIGQVTVEIK